MDALCDDGGRCSPAWAKWTDRIYHYHRDLEKAGPVPTPSGRMSTLPTYSVLSPIWKMVLSTVQSGFQRYGLPSKTDL